MTTTTLLFEYGDEYASQKNSYALNPLDRYVPPEEQNQDSDGAMYGDKSLPG